MKTKVYFQPFLYGTASDPNDLFCPDEMPVGLYSFQVFTSHEACVEWLSEHGYQKEEYYILKYGENDIEDFSIVK